jgi:hypothetical protein
VEWSLIVRALRRSGASVGLLIVMALTLSGCVHLDRNVALNGDGSGTYLLTIGISDQLLSISGDQVTSSMDSYGDKVKKEGGSYRRYEDAGYTDWAYTRPFASIADLNKLLQEAPQAGGASGLPSGSSTSTLDTITFSEQPGFLSNTFHVTGHMSMVVPTGSTDTGGVDVSTYLKDMRESLAVTMPGSISSHTGGVVEGATITYTVHFGEETDIDVTGSGLNTSTLIPLGVGAGALVLLLAAIAGFILWRRRSGSRGEPAPVYAGAYPGAPPTGPTAYANPYPSTPYPNTGPTGAGPTDPTIPGNAPPSTSWPRE